MAREAIKVYWWRWLDAQLGNVGDEFSLIVIQYLTGRRVEWSSEAECELIGAGSIIEGVLERGAGNMPKVWGSGFIEPPRATGQCLGASQVLAARGQVSRTRLVAGGKADCPLGDPGVLAALMYPGRPARKWRLGVVAHYIDEDHPLVHELGHQAQVCIISVRLPPSEFAAQIAACDAVVSSSLHGLIFADSLGVPNAHIRSSDRVAGDGYKFRDYYSAYPGESRERQVPLEIMGSGSAPKLGDWVHEKFVLPVGVEDLQEGLVVALRDGTR